MEQRNIKKMKELKKLEEEILKIIDEAEKSTPKDFLIDKKEELSIWKNKVEKEIIHINEAGTEDERADNLENLLMEEKIKLIEYLEKMIRQSIFVFDIDEMNNDKEDYSLTSLFYEWYLDEKLDQLRYDVKDKEKRIVQFQEILKKFEKETGIKEKLQTLEDYCKGKQVETELKNYKKRLDKLVTLILGRGLEGLSNKANTVIKYNFSIETRWFLAELYEERKNPNLKKIRAGKYLDIDGEFRDKIVTWLDLIQEDKYFSDMKISKDEIEDRKNNVFCTTYFDVDVEVQYIKTLVDNVFEVKECDQNRKIIMQIKKKLCDCSEEIQKLIWEMEL